MRYRFLGRARRDASPDGAGGRGPGATLARSLDLPPVWGAGCAALVWATARLGPALPLPAAVAPAGWALIAAGAALAAWAAALFAARRTPIEPRRTPRALITSGPYRWTRNPIYRGLALCLAGWALVVGEGAGLAVAGAYAALLIRRFAAPEEAALAAAFGESWAAYAARVRARL